MDNIKIQLNSEKAIRALIAEDPELELEIKTKIACSIAEGYEKINAGIVAQAVSTLSNEVSVLIWNDLTEIRKHGHWGSETFLKPDMQELITKKVHSCIDTLVFETVNKARDTIMENLEKRVDCLAEEIVRKTVNEVFENSVRDEVIRRYDVIQKALDAEETKS